MSTLFAHLKATYEIAQELFRNREFDKAIKTYSGLISAIQITSQSSEPDLNIPSLLSDIYYEIGMCFWNRHVNFTRNTLEDVDKALRCYIDSYLLKSDDQCLKYILDCINRLLDIYDSTTIILEIPAGKNADTIKKFCYNGAKSLFGQNYEVALNMYSYILKEIDPNCSIALHGYARALWGLGKYEEGLEAMSKACAIDSRIHPGLWHRVDIV